MGRMKVLLFMLMCTSAMLHAHQTALSFLSIVEKEPNRYDVTFKKPLVDINSDDLDLKYPTHCVDVLPLQISQSNGFRITLRSMACSGNGMEGASFRIHGLRAADKGVIFRFEGKQGDRLESIITAQHPVVILGVGTSDSTIAGDYFVLGVEHILMGWDHLLFVLALFLLIDHLSMLIKTVTAFTIAHSLTLALTVLGVVALPVVYVETMIAVSILLVARELLRTDASTLTHRYPWMIAMVFGLIHGFGFAAALHDVGIPEESVVLALLTFNLGVEAGQLLFIGALLGLRSVIRHSRLQYVFQNVSRSLAYGIGALAAFWFVERVSMFFA